MKKIFFSISVFILAAACSTNRSNDDIRKALKEDPTILADAISSHPAEFMAALEKAARQAQGRNAQAEQEREQQELEKSFENPLEPAIRSDESIRGNKNGPIACQPLFLWSTFL